MQYHVHVQSKTGDFFDEKLEVADLAACLRETTRTLLTAYIEADSQAEQDVIFTIAEEKGGKVLGSWRIAIQVPCETPCGECGGTGGVDSGGSTPWGAPIELPCPSCVPEQAKISNPHIEPPTNTATMKSVHTVYEANNGED